MTNFLFPFARVRQGARVVIYGCGEMGRQFLSQLEQSGYAKVVSCVDREVTELKSFPVTVNTVDNVAWNEKWYDYVVIAIQNRKVAVEIFALLVEYGVPEDKIVFPPLMPLLPVDMFRIQYSGGLNNEETLKNVLASYCDSAHKSIDSLFYVREWLREHDTVTLRERLKKWLRKKEYLCADEKAALLQQIYLAGMFDEDFVRIMLDVVPRMSRWQDGYAMLMDLSLVDAKLDNHIDWRYPDFYQDMHSGIKTVFEKSGLYMTPKVPSESRVIKRIAFVMTLYHSVRYAFGALLPLMNQLAEKDIKVSLFSLGTYFYDENELPDYVWQPMTKNCDMKPHGRDAHGYAVYLEEKKYFHPSIEVHDSYKLPLAVKLQEYLDEIDIFKPDAIVLFTDDRMPISYVMSKYYPVVQIPTKRLVSAMFYHAFVTTASKQKCLSENKFFNSLAEDRICTWGSDGIPFLGYLDKREYKRQAFGLADNDFVVVTVGLRLEQELTTNLISSMVSLLKRNSRVKWLLVYRNEPQRVSEYRELIYSGHIIMRGWEDNLPALYKICDAYLNPEREGGGVSLRLAMQVGIPVVSEDVTPLAGFLSPEFFVTGGPEKKVCELEKLANDDCYYAKKSSLMRESMARYKQGSTDKFLTILQETRNKFYAGDYQ